MKSRTILKPIALAAAFLLLLGYFGYQIFDALHDPFTLSPVTDTVTEDSVSLSGYLIREELLLPDQQGLFSLALTEGAKVGREQTVATVYSSDDAMALQAELDELKTREKQLSYAENTVLGSGTALRLDSEIIDTLLALRRDLASETMNGRTDGLISDVRELVLQRNFIADENTEQELREVREEIKALQNKLSGSAKAIAAPTSGIYSAVVDGYESVLTPETMEQLKPSDLKSPSASGAGSSIGKLITGSEWYFAAVVSRGTADRLTPGMSVKLRFRSTITEDLSCTVRSVSPEESGECVAILSCSRYLFELTQARPLSAELIFGSWRGLKVPAGALRVDPDGQTGVYCRVGLMARFKPVSVIHAEKEYYLVKADNPARETLRIRAGDEAITSSGELFDGMVINS